MPELTVVGFEGIHRATEGLRDLRDLVERVRRSSRARSASGR